MKSSIFFILYKPAVPGNIGASARAMKTMGFSELRLIDPADHLAGEALMMAHGSRDILDNAKIFTSFEEATADLDFIIASTAKNRSAREDYIDSHDLVDFLEQKKDLVGKIGMLFGTEESGLPNELIRRSHVGVSIPMTAPYPSLNLSQAVMIMAYELSHLSLPKEVSSKEDLSDAGWKELMFRVETTLALSGIKKENPVYHRILERIAFLNSGDARLLHSVTSRLTSQLDEEE